MTITPFPVGELSNLVHCIEALEYSPGAIIPPKTLTPLPVGDATGALLQIHIIPMAD